MKRIVQINVALNYGSTGRIAENIGLLANQQGYETYVVHGPRFMNPSKLKSICTETSWEEKVHGLQSLFGDGHGLGSKSATLNTIKKLEKIQPDLVHLHNIHGYYINYPILFDYLKKIGKPVVWTFHDCWNLTGHCAHFYAIGCERWKTGCFMCPNIKDYPKSLIDRSKRNYSLKKTCFTGLSDLTIVAVSEWLADLVHQSFLGEYPIKRIYNGINTDVFSPKVNQGLVRERYNVGNRLMILGVASPWTERKGLQDFLQLSRMLADDEVIVLVGVTKKQIKSLPDNVIGIERTDSLDLLVDLYSSADVFFNPSKQETFGMTTVEALACGTPAIVYNVTACPEIIDSSCGFVLDCGDVKSVRNAISTIRDKGKGYYSANCRNRVVLNFNEKDRYNDYIQLYNKLLST